jgi:cytochrome c peroxidase
VPAHFPAIPHPADNPLTKEKIDLGRYLFYEKILSVDSTLCCESCHNRQAFFSTRGTQLSFGYKGDQTLRNCISLCNVAYRDTLTWDGLVTGDNGVEVIALAVFSIPVEFHNDSAEVTRRLVNNPKYIDLFKKAFNRLPNAYDASYAIAAFIRTFVTGNSRYDQYLLGNKSALSAQEKQGMDLFNSDRTKCSVCHSGLFFTDNNFHNTGTSTHYFDRGRFYVTNDYRDRNKFRTPSLRNVAQTYPYLHNGDYSSLEEIVANYVKGGNYFISKDTIIKPLDLNQTEINSLIAFLKTLTDSSFLSNTFYDKPKD